MSYFGLGMSQGRAGKEQDMSYQRSVLCAWKCPDARKQLISLMPNAVLCAPGKLMLEPPLRSLDLNIQGCDWCDDVGQHSALGSQTLVVAGAQGCHGLPTNISHFPSPDEIAVAVLNMSADIHVSILLAGSVSWHLLYSVFYCLFLYTRID